MVQSYPGPVPVKYVFHKCMLSQKCYKPLRDSMPSGKAGAAYTSVHQNTSWTRVGMGRVGQWRVVKELGRGESALQLDSAAWVYAISKSSSKPDFLPICINQ